jgi:hypothetical protein
MCEAQPTPAPGDTSAIASPHTAQLSLLQQGRADAGGEGWMRVDCATRTAFRIAAPRAAASRRAHAACTCSVTLAASSRSSSGGSNGASRRGAPPTEVMVLKTGPVCVPRHSRCRRCPCKRSHTSIVENVSSSWSSSSGSPPLHGHLWLRKFNGKREHGSIQGSAGPGFCSI